MTITESHDFVPFEMFVPAESEIVPALLGCGCCPIAVDHADIQQLLLLKQQHRTRENGIKAPLGLIAPKGSIDSGIVAFRLPIFVLLDRQFLSLTAKIQQFQNVVEDRVQREFWLRSATANMQMGQDKFIKLFAGQMRGNPLSLLRLSHSCFECLLNEKGWSHFSQKR